MRSSVTFLVQAFLSVVHVQLVLFLITLPIISSWGLRFSFATVIGNLVFTPFATLFLALSMIWFMGHSIGLPTTWVQFALESLASWWIKLLAYGSPRYLFAVPKAATFLIILMPLIVGVILYSSLRTRYGLPYEVLILATLAGGWCLGLKTLARACEPVPVTQWGKTIWLYPTKEGVDLVDSEGVLRCLPPHHTTAWVRFTLHPALATSFGTCRCNTIALLHPTFQRLIAAAHLIREGGAESITVPEWVSSKRWFIRWRAQFPEVVVKTLTERRKDAILESLAIHTNKL